MTLLNSRVLNLVLLMSCLILGAMFLDQCQKKEDLIVDNENLNSWRDSTKLVLEEQKAQNSALQTANRQSFIEIENLEGEKKALQNLVKSERNINAALRSRIAIYVNESTTDVEIHLPNEVQNDSTENIFYADSSVALPTYRGSISDSTWYTADITAGPESISMVLELNADFSYTWKYSRTKGIFSVKEPVVKAETSNPYINFTALESWTQKEKPPRMSWGVTAALGLSTNLEPVIAVVLGPSFRVRDW